MPQVRFRFYGALNDFLPPFRRGRAFVHRLPERTSIKDAVEGLGVPHPEIDLIIVDREPASFEYRIHHGDRVAVYPPFHSLEMRELARVGSEPLHPVRFVTDVHLGRLTAWLRLAGFDSETVADDEAIARRSADERRVVLTRDVELLKRRAIRHGHWVRHIDPMRQLVEVLDRFGLAGEMMPFSRCLHCNAPLVAVAAADVREQLRPGTRAAFAAFRRCSGCARVYWEGSHYTALRQVLERATRVLEDLAARR